jgi:hypothetical protein
LQSRYSIKLYVKLPKLKVLTVSWAKTHDAIKKLRWAENKGKKYKVKLKNASIWSFLEFHFVFLCFFPMHLDSKVFVSHANWQHSSFVCEWEMLQATNVRVQVANVRCSVSKWTMSIVGGLQTQSKELVCLRLKNWNSSILCWIFVWATTFEKRKRTKVGGTWSQWLWFGGLDVWLWY